MTNRTQQEILFEQFRESGGGALAELLEQEKELLFDFILRMTGQYDRSYRTSNDVLAEIEYGNRRWETLAELRIYIFLQCREECMDVWNAASEKLENISLEHELEWEDTTDDSADQIKRQQEIDRAIARLSPQRREAVLLNCRHNFSLEASAKIMDSEVSVIATEISAGLKCFSRDYSGLINDPRMEVGSLAPHPCPIDETVYMTDLQKIMGEIDRGIPGEYRRAFRASLMLMVVILVGYGYFAEGQPLVLLWGWMKSIGSALWDVVFG